MTKLAETYFRLGIRLEPSDQAALESYIENQASFYAVGLFGQRPIFSTYVDDGSIRTWLVVAGSIYMGIGQYGSFRSGIDYAIKDARTFSERMFDDVRQIGIPQSDILRFERRLGVPGKIERTFRRIEHLQKYGKILSDNKRVRELEAIKKGLIDILENVDVPSDRALVLENLPQPLRSILPDPLPIPELSKEPRVALRPEEWSSLQTTSSMIDGTNERPLHSMLPLSRLRLTDSTVIGEGFAGGRSTERLYRFDASGPTLRPVGED